MTDEEKIKWQTEQDAITLDYSKWSFQQVRAKRPNDHELWKEQRDDVLARQNAKNAETRRKYLDGLKAAKAQKQAETDAQIDLELEPEKRRIQNEWLANNPNETADDFEKKAWHLLKANLIEQRSAKIMEATIQDLAASGRYSL